MKHLITILFILLGTILFAQYETGNWYLSQPSGAQLSTNPQSPNSILSGQIFGGCFVQNRLLIGASFRHRDILEEDREGDFDFSPFIRYYLASGEEVRYNFFGELGFGYTPNGPRQFNAFAAIGAERRLMPGVMANVRFGYTYVDSRRDANFDLDLGLNLLFGQFTVGEQRDYTRQKGDVLLDTGRGSLSLQGSSSIRFSIGNVNLRGGYFLTDNLLVNGQLNFFRNRVNFRAPSDLDYIQLTNFQGAIGLQYLFNNKRRFQPYVSAHLLTAFQRNKTVEATMVGQEEDILSFESSSADFRAGLYYHLRSQVALSLEVGVQRELSASNTFVETKAVGSIGVVVFLPGK